MKTAGVVFDFYDDPAGAVLRRAFPSAGDLPDIIKEAHILSEEERGVLRNEAYALVMHDEGRLMRKFACVDRGNTALSAIYFLEHHDRLPEEAVKVAAANLIEFCEEFGLPTDGLVKVAATQYRMRDPGVTNTKTNEDADWAQRANLHSINGNESSKVLSTAAQVKTAGSLAREVGTNTAANLISMGLVGAGSYGLGKASGGGKSKKAHIVDVSGAEAPLRIETRTSQRTALDGRYSLDSYTDVEKAISYFEENYGSMSPADCHEFAVKTASRAEELGIPVPELTGRYGSTHYADDVEGHLISRKNICDEEFRGVYDELIEKRAFIEPKAFVELLTEADVASGLNWHWNGYIGDPYFATFGGASEKTASAEFSWTGRVGDHVNADQLLDLARNGRPLVHKHFSSDLTNAFIADPITIFQSLPDDSKAIFARLANDMRDGLSNN